MFFVYAPSEPPEPSTSTMGTHKKAQKGRPEPTARAAVAPAPSKGDAAKAAADKAKDPRFKWFTANHGKRCWELDAMDPNDLRGCVEAEIKKLIEPVAWKRCEVVNAAEQASLRDILKAWPR